VVRLAVEPPVWKNSTSPVAAIFRRQPPSYGDTTNAALIKRFHAAKGGPRSQRAALQTVRARDVQVARRDVEQSSSARLDRPYDGSFSTMIKSITAIAATAMMLAACGQKDADHAPDRTEGPAVAAAQGPTNPAVDTTPEKTGPGLSAGANSFTEAQAKSAIEKAGYTGVGPLTQNANGVWQGQATRDGAETTVAVDYKGAILAPQTASGNH
jgi:predicted small lipoprotein YifL